MKLRLHVQDGPKTYEFEHAGPAVRVGREPGGDLVFEQDSPDSVVSWNHARIDLSPREATLTDLRSTNGTYRNEQRVEGAVPLWPGDTVRLGASGPILTVVEVDLSPSAVPPPPKPAPRAVAAAPVVATAIKPPRAKAPAAPAPAVSETRGIALQAVQALKAQQEQLRAQQAAHARHKQSLAVVACVGLLLLLLLGGGLWSFRGGLRELFGVTEKLQGDVADTQKNVDQLGREMRGLAQQTADHFEKVEKEQEQQRQAQNEQFAKLDQIAQEQIRQEAAAKGGLDRLKQEWGATLDELNRRLAAPQPQAAARAEPPPPPPPAQPAAAAAANARGPRIEPGMKMDVIVKNKGFYTGVLVGITGERVRLQTIPDPQAKPSEWDIREVQAFQTRDGIFAYNESAGTFEPALTYYRFDKSSGQFVRAESGSGNAYLEEDAQVLGPTNSARALLARGPSGEWTVGLPVPASRGPEAIPAYHFREIITSKGIYTFDEQKRDFVFKAHTKIAAEAREARDEYWRQVDKQQWERRKESYQLVTDRLHALRPYFWGRWWWW